ncbi:serine/threonine-protein kinase pim-1-like [Montipora capricornis]|uniref:serine/threonine-protein kinase pim-1-like n=1 Tax=Montipora capricornis TaxID=246305 RepID=UPI0035F1AF5A
MAWASNASTMNPELPREKARKEQMEGNGSCCFQGSAHNTQANDEQESDCSSNEQEVGLSGIMGDTAKRFSSLLTVICRTAKRSANKVAKMRKKRNGGGEEINQLATRSADPVVRSSCKVRSSLKTAMTPDEKVEQHFNETYELHKLLGQGGFAVVYSGTRVRDNVPVAVKIIPKCNVYSFEEESEGSIPMEVHLHRFLDHPNVIKLYDFFEHAQAYVMVLERPMYHKDLFDYISEKRRLEESEARSIFRQVVEAVMHCESKGIFHRDIKDENILLDTMTGQVKLLDFGSGTGLENTLYTDYEGTRAYCPPEWFRFHRYYARPATVWSLGILLHNMVMGDVPFRNEVEIVRAELNFPDDVSKDLQDILRCLLAKHPSYRPTLEEVIQHSWLQHRRYKVRLATDRRACQSAPIPGDIPGDIPKGNHERCFQRGNSLL